MLLRNILRPVSLRRHIAPVLVLGVAGVAVACSDAPTGPAPTAPAPAAAPSLAMGTTTATSVNVLKWNSAASQMTVSATIGSAGGSITMGGVTLTVPRGAVSTSTSFGITRLPGRVVAYDFQPHGRVFATPVTIRHTAAGTNMTQVSASALQGAYFPQATSLDQTYGTASVTEFRPTAVATDRSSVAFTTTHFSGYLIATGRR